MRSAFGLDPKGALSSSGKFLKAEGKGTWLVSVGVVATRTMTIISANIASILPKVIHLVQASGAGYSPIPISYGRHVYS